jgi:carboxylesterase
MPIRPGAQAWSVDGDDRIGVLLLHGFTGSPASMRPWGEQLAQRSWTVRVPRLPGHGTRWQDMNITRWQDWYSEADRNLRELTSRCDQVFVGGLSMGGSLALRLAQEHPQAISGLVLVNPSVHTERLDRHLLPVVKHLVGSFPGISNDIAKPGVDEIPYNRTPLKAAASLMEMWSVIKRDIASVHQPLLLFRSAQDHVVEPSNAEWILSHIHSSDVEEVVLDNSYHVATLDYDAQIIVDTSVAFIERLSQSQ